METLTETTAQTAWFLACRVEDTIPNGGVCIKHGNEQVALFYFSRQDKWYAVQNECPHRKQMALSRGMVGSVGEEPKIACPFHKKQFSLASGECLSGGECALKTYCVKVIDGNVFIATTQKIKWIT